VTPDRQTPITVVITNYNRRDDLRQALLSVRAQDHPRVSTVVVDNASADGSREMVREEFPEVELVALDDNPGMAGYSVGFERAGTELLFQMDNDSLIPDPTVLTEVTRCLAEGPPELAAVACRVEEYRQGDDVEALRARDRRRGPIDTGGFHAGGVGFRKPLLERVGYYHREVFLYGSELFLQMKILAAGYRIHHHPEILMLHKSSGTARSSLAVYYELRNRYWFFRRFATAGQRWRHLPPMLVHDALYALAKKRPGSFLSALRDGFAPLPGELAQPLRSPLPSFRRKVDEMGRRFGPAAILRSVLRR